MGNDKLKNLTKRGELFNKPYRHDGGYNTKGYQTKKLVLIRLCPYRDQRLDDPENIQKGKTLGSSA